MAPLVFNGRKVLYALFPVLIIYAILMFVDIFFLDSSNTMLASFRMSFGASSGAVRLLDVGKGVVKKWRWFLPLYILIVVLTPVLAIPFILYDLIMILYAVFYWFGYKSLENRLRSVPAKPRLADGRKEKGKGRVQTTDAAILQRLAEKPPPPSDQRPGSSREDADYDTDAPFR